MNRTAGGTFNPADRPLYFIASNVDRMRYGAPVHENLLVAVNEIKDPDVPVLARWLDTGKRVFIDSGIFNLTNTHARAHGIPMDHALALAPDAIDGFDQLFDRYVQLVTTYGDRSWGYIELDQGGRENKKRTRARLESLGLAPIPVYHPLNDGWDYFDELASQYDRICFGNIVQADPATRRRLVATAWQRHREYPHLWIHLLGYTPNQLLHAYPANSGDSSSWLHGVRWGGYGERAAGVALSALPKHFQYVPGSDPTTPIGNQAGTRMCAFGAYCAQRNWTAFHRTMEDFGWEPYPPRPALPAAP